VTELHTLVCYRQDDYEGTLVHKQHQTLEESLYSNRTTAVHQLVVLLLFVPYTFKQKQSTAKLPSEYSIVKCSG